VSRVTSREVTPVEGRTPAGMTARPGVRPLGQQSTQRRRLHSVRARERLEPLVAALEARPGGDPRELARTARQVAATRA